MNKRLNQYGLKTEELGGGGNCFFNSIAPQIGMSPVDLRHGVANHMRQYESEYNKYGNFIQVGGFKSYCDRVKKTGVYVEGNAEIAATADFLGRDIYIFAGNKENDVFIRAGNLGALTTGDAKGKTIMIAHFLNGEHYTGVRRIQDDWKASKGPNKRKEYRKGRATRTNKVPGRPEQEQEQQEQEQEQTRERR